MIGKIVIGKSFRGCLRYVVQKQDAEILLAEGVRAGDASQMTRDFNMQRKLKPSLGNAVGHFLSVGALRTPTNFPMQAC